MSGQIATDTLLRAFHHTFEREPTGTLFSPGRVNLIGEHIDYCGGLVLPMAISRGTHMAFAANDSDRVRIYSERFQALETLTPGIQARPRGHWTDYVVGVARQLKFDRGADIYVVDDIACGGLSSSASFSVGVARVFCSIAGSEPDGEAALLHLAQLCRRAENEFVGVPCGIMDQASVILGGIIKLDCSTLKFDRVETGFDDCALVVMDTGKPRTLAASKYAERVAEIASICRSLGGEIRPESLCRDVSTEILGDCGGRLTPTLQKRLRHVVTEQGRVEQAFAALLRRDYTRLGELMSASHLSLSNDYEVTGHELDAIVAASRAQPGVLGARMTGAGFGGCAIALVKLDRVAAHNREVVNCYREVTGLEASLFVV